MEPHYNLSSFINLKYDHDVRSSSVSEDAAATQTQTVLCVSKKRGPPSDFETSRQMSHNRAVRTSKSKTEDIRVTRMNKRTVQDTTRGLTNALDLPLNKIVCALYEVRNHTQTRIGLCIANLNIGLLNFSEFIDSSIYIRTIHKLQIHQPHEIILPSGSMSPTPSKLVSVVKSNLPDGSKVISSPSKSFNASIGIDYIRRFAIDPLHDDRSTGRYTEKLFGLQAIAGALEYVTSKQGNTKGYPHFSKLRCCFETADDTMLIDTLTIRALELVESNMGRNQSSLLRTLDLTSTPMGKRLLRTNILQPLTNKESIEMRQIAVEELMNNEPLLDSIISNLKGLQDLDAIFSKLFSENYSEIQPEQKINYVLIIKDTICRTFEIQNCFQGRKIESSLLTEILGILSSPILKTVQREIDLVIEDDCNWATSNIELQHQRIHAIKNGSNGLLEATRNVFKNTIDQIYQEIETMSTKASLPISHNYVPTRGFLMCISRNECPDINQLPDEMINQVYRGKSIECSTLALEKLNCRLKDVVVEIFLLSEKSVHTLLNNISIHVSALFMISEALSMLDLLCCFANNSRKYNYCVPVVGTNMQIKDSRHPVLSRQLKTFIPNDITINRGSSNVQIITGCNMSGKTVYLKQLAMLCIMFQMGSPIPAKKAIFPIFQNLHTRLCTDSLEFASSSFMFEMKEIAYCLEELSENSLLILDELGRNTSPNDGLAISLAITEHVLESGCTAFISTHFQEIPQALVCRPAVIHLMMNTTQTNNQVNMLYTISETTGSSSSYNVLEAITGLLPKLILDDGFKIKAKLEESKNSIKKKIQQNEDDTTITPFDVNQIKKIHNLLSVLEQLTETSEISLEVLEKLQSNFVDIFDSD